MTAILIETQLKKSFNKKEFSSGASVFKLLAWYYVSVLFFRSGLIPFSIILVFILKIFGAKIGKDVRIKPFVNIKYPWKLIMGDHSWIGENCTLENLDTITLGTNVCISQRAMLLTGNHNYKISTFDLITKPIYLENGVWIGANAVVCPGVIAASHSILTVGSIATQNLEAFSIYQGNPAVKIRTRTIQD